MSANFDDDEDLEVEFKARRVFSCDAANLVSAIVMSPEVALCVYRRTDYNLLVARETVRAELGIFFR
ncbi:hypothetical protein [Caulobacter segnis]|uniref:Uncharacterized protein n=1 Tax=Caulobacter segnis TaxID=88688 RepID=A0A2W5WXU9_9CAUL|nr:hypothetical protein [Caulobacter segnis]PZR32924.1 MAG: hypothetical protein DI526_15005 [Caulobacter segnis]